MAYLERPNTAPATTTRPFPNDEEDASKNVLVAVRYVLRVCAPRRAANRRDAATALRARCGLNLLWRRALTCCSVLAGERGSVRPETKKEIAGDFCTIVEAIDDKVLAFDPERRTGGRSGMPAHVRQARDKQYAFDRVFGESASQQAVFEGTTEHLIDRVIAGYNATVFAYGATGAGKTYTMMGTAQNPGVVVLTMQELFRRVDQSTETRFKIAVQYLEIYNETLHDLLAPSGPLPLRADPQGGCAAAGLSQHHPTSALEVLQLLERGNQNRTQLPTEANSESSRSHAVFQILLSVQDRTANVRTRKRVGKLSLIDLAGSERAKMTKNRGDRLVEGANINRSLLALGNCINALCSGRKHIPYRDSKLTRLLQDSLGGNCQTVMIANVSPSSMMYEDTHNTLEYANRAKEIKTRVERNIVSVEHHVTEYVRLIGELRAEIAELKARPAPRTRTPERGAPAPALDTSAADRERVARFKAKLGVLLQHRQKLTADLAELRAIQAQNEREVAEFELRMGAFRRAQPDATTPTDLRRMRREVEHVRQSSRVNEAMRTNVAQQLAANMRQVQNLQDTTDASVASPSKRELLALLVRTATESLAAGEAARLQEFHAAALKRRDAEIAELSERLARLQATVRAQVTSAAAAVAATSPRPMTSSGFRGAPAGLGAEVSVSPIGPPPQPPPLPPLPLFAAPAREIVGEGDGGAGGGGNVGGSGSSSDSLETELLGGRVVARGSETPSPVAQRKLKRIRRVVRRRRAAPEPAPPADACGVAGAGDRRARKAVAGRQDGADKENAAAWLRRQ